MTTDATDTAWHITDMTTLDASYRLSLRLPHARRFGVFALATMAVAACAQPPEERESDPTEVPTAAEEDGRVGQTSSEYIAPFMVSLSCYGSDNYLLNADFSSRAARTIQTTTVESPTITLDSAAGSWYARNGAAGTTTTEVVDAPEGRMLHVTTTAPSSGVLQQFLPVTTGLDVAAAASFVRVVSGQVGFVLGAIGQGGPGDTGVYTCDTYALGLYCDRRDPKNPVLWHPLEATASGMPIYTRANDSAPANQFGILSVGGPAEFYVWRPWVASCGGVRVVGSRLTSAVVNRLTCPATITVSGSFDIVGSGRLQYDVRTGADGRYRGSRQALTATGTGTYPFSASFRAYDKIESSTVWVDTLGANYRRTNELPYAATCRRPR